MTTLPGIGPRLKAQLAEAAKAGDIAVPASRFGFGTRRYNRLPRLLACGLVEWVELGSTVRLTAKALALFGGVHSL